MMFFCIKMMFFCTKIVFFAQNKINMNLKEIQELIKFVAKSGATEVDLEIDNVKISIKSPSKKRRGVQTDDVITVVPSAPAIQQVQPAPQIIHQETQIPTQKTEIKDTAKEEKSDNDEKYITINASMIGTFYRSSSPETPPFVNVGDTIKEGDTLCIIEAMKLFNEIESEISGKIIKVLVDDSTPVEFDQPLFLIDPS
jgi:acetyl-CoA carboxylase biotin carboxyl carrier protein